MSSPSLLLVDVVRVVVAEGKPVTARMVARRVGDDVFKVEEILRSLVKQGKLSARGQRPTSRFAPPATLYVSVIARPRRTRVQGDDDQRIVPLPGQKSFPVF